MKFNSLSKAELVESYLKDALIYWKKRKQEFNGDIPSMQVDGSPFAGGRIDIEHIENNIKQCSEILGEVCHLVYMMEKEND